MAVDRLFVEWLDINQNFLRTANYVAAPANAAAYLAALQGASNAGQVITTEGPAAFPTTAPVDATYPSALDTAVLNFMATGGAAVIVTVPAPISALFLGDNETVDPTDPTGLIAACSAALGDVLGNSILLFRSGVRAQRRKDVV
jgi:hypothetical protein